MVDSIAETIRSNNVGEALESLTALLKFAENIEKARYVVTLLQTGFRIGAELDQQIAAKRATLDENINKMLDDKRVEANHQRDAIIEAAKAEAKAIVDAGNARLAEVEAAIKAKTAELVLVTNDFNAMRNTLRDHAERVKQITG